MLTYTNAEIAQLSMTNQTRSKPTCHNHQHLQAGHQLMSMPQQTGLGSVMLPPHLLISSILNGLKGGSRADQGCEPVDQRRGGSIEPVYKALALKTVRQTSDLMDESVFEEGMSMKPNFSYIGLIAKAILSVEDQRMVLSEIYHWIQQHYPYFRSRGPGWRNSIRHNLSLNDCFVKVGRASNGKGHFWGIHPANLQDFVSGDFRRRRAQRKVRQALGIISPTDISDSDTPSPSPYYFPPELASILPTGCIGSHVWRPEQAILDQRSDSPAIGCPEGSGTGGLSEPTTSTCGYRTLPRLKRTSADWLVQVKTEITTQRCQKTDKPCQNTLLNLPVNDGWKECEAKHFCVKSTPRRRDFTVASLLFDDKVEKREKEENLSFLSSLEVKERDWLLEHQGRLRVKENILTPYNSFAPLSHLSENNNLRSLTALDYTARTLTNSMLK